MKIAAFLPRVPWPLEKGDKLRAFHMLKQLSAEHKIYLFALAEHQREWNSMSVLEDFCEIVEIFPMSKQGIAGGIIKALQAGWPLQVGYYYNGNAIKRWQQFINEIKPDHIFYQLIRTLPYANAVKGVPSTLDYQDTFSLSMARQAESSMIPMKWIWQREAKTVANFEQRAFGETTNQLIISGQDRQHLPVSDPGRIHIITNGISLDDFQPHNVEKEVDLIFAGNMGYKPNILAAKFLAKEIMPYIWGQRPDTTLALVGIHPPTSVKQLANDRIKVTGYVKDITGWYAKARILVAPMQSGAGLQNKILEAMAMELPCVVSDIAQKGLPEKAHELVLTENTAEDMADAVLTILEDERYGQMLGRQGRKYVEENHSWKHVGEELEKVISGQHKP